jgi:hypothetical protein
MSDGLGESYKFYADPEDLAREEARRQQSQQQPDDDASGKANGLDTHPWPMLDKAARYGLLGEIVDTIEPHTEADPVAILFQTLASFGNAIGRGPYYQVEGDQHTTNIFGLLVGATSKGRKGVSKGRVEQIMAVADPFWATSRTDSGLSSGEGLIWAIRDPILRWEKQGKGADAVRVEVVVDPGIDDKRLYVVETEFASVLAAAKREGNTLSRVIRDAWDRPCLATLTKNSPARATGALISIIGHITIDELCRDLDRVSIANGFINRFMILCARRSQCLPFGGALKPDDCQKLGAKLSQAIEKARSIAEVGMDEVAKEMWAALYPTLSAGQPGLFGAVIARAEAQTIRLALNYALLDGASVIRPDHLEAATALWDYAEDSARYVFGDALGDPVADEILHSLREAGVAGMTRTQIRDLFGRNRDSDQISRALAALRRAGKARQEMRKGNTKPFECWVAEG